MHVHGRVRGMEGPENKDAVLDLLALLPAHHPLLEITTTSVLYICDHAHTKKNTFTDTHTHTHTHRRAS